MKYIGTLSEDFDYKVELEAARAEKYGNSNWYEHYNWFSYEKAAIFGGCCIDYKSVYWEERKRISCSTYGFQSFLHLEERVFCSAAEGNVGCPLQGVWDIGNR